MNIQEVQTRFNTFAKDHKNWIQSLKDQSGIEIYIRDSSRFQRIIFKFRETYKQKIPLDHEYHAIIDTTDGEFFLDSRKKTIFAKHVIAAIILIPKLVIQTFYYLSMIPVIVELTRSKVDLSAAIYSSLVDVFKTPYYMLQIEVLLIVGIAGSILGSPNILYFTTKWIGKLQFKLTNTKTYKHSDFNANKAVMACLGPIGHIGEIDRWIWLPEVNCRKDPKVNDPLDFSEIKEGESYFACKQIEFLRYSNTVFNPLSWISPCQIRLGNSEAYKTFDRPAHSII